MTNRAVWSDEFVRGLSNSTTLRGLSPGFTHVYRVEQNSILLDLTRLFKILHDNKYNNKKIVPENI